MTFIKYQNIKLFRSYSFIPPYAFFIIGIMLFYFYKNQMILPSYASSMTLLYATLSWLTIINFKFRFYTRKTYAFYSV